MPLGVHPSQGSDELERNTGGGLCSAAMATGALFVLEVVVVVVVIVLLRCV